MSDFGMSIVIGIGMVAVAKIINAFYEPATREGPSLPIGANRSPSGTVILLYDHATGKSNTRTYTGDVGSSTQSGHREAGPVDRSQASHVDHAGLDGGGGAHGPV